ncbi:MAG: xanthine dehydrogenase accessory protein XdhC [Pseudomonadota bacterium]
MSAIWVEIVDARGSTPRDVGTAMKVTVGGIEGTIGGGALEYRAIAEARDFLVDGRDDVRRSYPLGPDLGQCCGGAVTLNFTRKERQTDRAEAQILKPRTKTSNQGLLWLWGAGHVGRAVVRTLHPQAFKVTWVDSSADRFPDHVGDHVTVTPAADMPLLATRAPTDAHHLIFTYSHDIDLALCAALLKRGAASIGLIGSDTKRARFFKRLRDMGLDPEPIQCPIGDKSLGKEPNAIAKGVVEALLKS